MDFEIKIFTFESILMRSFATPCETSRRHAAQNFEKLFFASHDPKNPPPNFCAFLIIFRWVRTFLLKTPPLVGLPPLILTSENKKALSAVLEQRHEKSFSRILTCHRPQKRFKGILKIEKEKYGHSKDNPTKIPSCRPISGELVWPIWWFSLV